MSITLQIEDMTFAEKLSAMELIWASLSNHEKSNISPAWHEQVLLETEARLAKGDEPVLDWQQAKDELRRQFQ